MSQKPATSSLFLCSRLTCVTLEALFSFSESSFLLFSGMNKRCSQCGLVHGPQPVHEPCKVGLEMGCNSFFFTVLRSTTVLDRDGHLATELNTLLGVTANKFGYEYS